MREEKRKLLINNENYSDAPIRIGEKVDSFHWECVYVDESHSIRKVRVVHSQETEIKSALLMLIRSFVDSGLISKSALQSELSRGRAGRKQLEIDETTGKVNGSMKVINKQIVELWNEGKEVDEIATKLRGKLKNKRRQNFITKIRRILLSNKKLLLRPYRQEIDFQTDRK